MKQATYTSLADVGVIVGRFQTDELHRAHVDLIQTVIDMHERVIVFLGVAKIPSTEYDPLDYHSREMMIKASFPNVTISYIADMKHDAQWSLVLDEKISELIAPTHTAMLYGGRDSFIKHYVGKWQTQELESDGYINDSATQIRHRLGLQRTNSREFRAGWICATQSQFPRTLPTVDVAIMNGDDTKVLLGRKPYEAKQLCFIGGFADPKSPSYEADACREVYEETNLEVTDPYYVGSCFIDDWRYRNGKDKIKTIFFICSVMYGALRAQDDIAEVRWVPIKDLERDDSILVEHHRPLLQMLLKYLYK